MAKRTRAAAEAKWPGVPFRKILHVKEDEECVVIGTVFKNVKLRPNLIETYTKDRRLREAVEDVRFASREDTLILEDEGARMALGCARAGALPARALSTGVVCAVRGRDRDGTFLVEDMCFPGLGPQRPLTRVPGSPMVALVSGLGLSRDSNLMLAQQLVDWVSGNLGSPEDQARASRVCRVVIVGGTVVGAAKLA